jgi:predicted PurR-regulated permease PerM
MLNSSSPAPRAWWQRLNLGETALATVVVMLVVLAVLALLAARTILAGVFLGVLLATGLRPLMAWLQRMRLPRHAAASIALGLLVATLAGIVALIAPLVAAQTAALATALPELLADLQRQLLSSPLALVRQLGAQLRMIGITAADPAGGSASGLVDTLIAWAPGFARVLFFALSILLFAYYWLLYRDRSVSGLLLLLAPERRDAVESVWRQIESRIGAFVRGQIALGVVTGVCSLIGYWAIGLPYALVLALIAGLLEFIPFLGAILATGLAVTVGLSVSPQLALMALGVGLIIQQLENNLLAPRIMEKAVGISPVVTLLAFVGFAALFGPIGGFVAVPLAAALQLIFRAWADRQSLDHVPGEQRDEIARLRYAAADLSQDLARRLRERPDADDEPLDDPEEQIEAVLIDLQALLDRREEARA